MVFLTVSSGIGGGIVLGGRLLRGARGIAGSLGQTPRPGHDRFVRLETLASGFGIAAAAKASGREADARAVFAAARAGEPWADGILMEAADELAAAIAGLQAVVDPDCIVIGGGVGLAEGFLERLEAALQAYPVVHRAGARPRRARRRRRHHRRGEPGACPRSDGQDPTIWRRTCMTLRTFASVARHRRSGRRDFRRRRHG